MYDRTMRVIGWAQAGMLRLQFGQGLAEYALILALIAILAIVALLFLGGKIDTVLSKVGNSV